MAGSRTKNLSVVGADGAKRREIDGNRSRARRIFAFAVLSGNDQGLEKTKGKSDRLRSVSVDHLPFDFSDEISDLTAYFHCTERTNVPLRMRILFERVVFEL